MDTIQNSSRPDTMEQILIGQLIVPKDAVKEFYERLNINRNFIKNLPGFIEDNVYERTDEQGNIIVISVATWENGAAIKNAKGAVQAEYKREGFDMQAMLKRLNITIASDALYIKVKN